jgi:hypothetical protein
MRLVGVEPTRPKASRPQRDKSTIPSEPLLLHAGGEIRTPKPRGRLFYINDTQVQGVGVEPTQSKTFGLRPSELANVQPLLLAVYTTVNIHEL